MINIYQIRFRIAVSVGEDFCLLRLTIYIAISHRVIANIPRNLFKCEIEIVDLFAQFTKINT